MISTSSMRPILQIIYLQTELLNKVQQSFSFIGYDPSINKGGAGPD